MTTDIKKTFSKVQKRDWIFKCMRAKFIKTEDAAVTRNSSVEIPAGSKFQQVGGRIHATVLFELK